MAAMRGAALITLLVVAFALAALVLANRERT